MGLGYRAPLSRSIVQNLDEIDFLEVVSDSFFRHEVSLRALTTLKPVIPHSLALSVGSTLDDAYLARVKRIVELCGPPWWSDHLAFTRAGGRDIGHLAPVAHNEESLSTVVKNVKRVQQEVGGAFAVENITMPFYWPDSTMSEEAFLCELVRQTGCYLLLDLENVRVNAANHQRDAHRFLEALPLERIAQVHIAGGTHDEDLEHDTHSAPVSEGTWKLLEHLCEMHPPPGVLIERDAGFPPFVDLVAELRRARRILRRRAA